MCHQKKLKIKRNNESSGGSEERTLWVEKPRRKHNFMSFESHHAVPASMWEVLRFRMWKGKLFYRETLNAFSPSSAEQPMAVKKIRKENAVYLCRL